MGNKKTAFWSGQSIAMGGADLTKGTRITTKPRNPGKYSLGVIINDPETPFFRNKEVNL